MNNEQKDHSLPSASLVQNGLLSAALSVEEGNKLIAEFMGYVYLPDGTINGIEGILVHKDRMSMHLDVTKQFHAKYHSSWDWLMPVVEKIEAFKGIRLLMKPFACEILIFGKSLINEAGNTKIESIWLAVIEFIKWYNVNVAAVGSR